MFNKLTLTIVAILAGVGFIHAQDTNIAQLRIMQLSFVPDVSATVNIALDELDEELLFEDISFPFTTDYVEIPAGDHTLTTTIVDMVEATASTDLILEAGHQYSLVVEGDYTSDTVQFVLIDESDLLTDETGSVAIVVNLTPMAMNLFIEDEMVVEGLTTGDYSSISLPLTKFTAFGSFAGTSDEQVEIGTFMPLPNATVLGVARLTDRGDLQTILQRSSDWMIADYFQATVPDTAFHLSASTLASTDVLELLSDTGAYTVFLPSNDAFGDVAPEDFAELASDHIIPENLPPTILPEHETLTTISGDTASLQFSDTESGYWEIEGAPILWDVRLGNGVIYVIDDVITSSD